MQSQGQGGRAPPWPPCWVSSPAPCVFGYGLTIGRTWGYIRLFLRSTAQPLCTYQVSDHIQSLFSKVTIGLIPSRTVPFPARSTR
jgi:hypothetical protein